MSDTRAFDPDFPPPSNNGLPPEWEPVTPAAPVEPTPAPQPEPDPVPASQEVPPVEETAPADELPSDDAVLSDEDVDPETAPIEETLADDVRVENVEQFDKDLRAFDQQQIPTHDADEILLIKTDINSVMDQLSALEQNMGAEKFLREVLTDGSSTNLLYRFVLDTYSDSYRVQEMLAKLPKEARDKLSCVYADPNNPKRELRRYIIREAVPNGNVVVDGDDSYQRMMGMGGCARGMFPLYESGIAIALIVPQNNDFDTLFNMLAEDEIAQYTNVGLEAANLTLYRMKEITLNWLTQFITDCSYKNWMKSGALAKIVTLNDFGALLTYLGHLSYPNGFDRFVDKCFRPIDKEHPKGCDYSSQITITPGDLLVTRFSLMTEKQLAYMFDRISKRPVTMAEIQDYKSGFAFGQKIIQHREWTFTLSTPVLERYFTVGNLSYAASASVILSGNTPSILQDMVSKGFRDLSVYVSAITRSVDGKSMTTHSPKGIMELLGAITTEDMKVCDPDKPEEWILQKIRDFSDQCQLTYVGFQSKPCPTCGYINHETDGWAAIDPLRVFFTIGRSTQ